MLSRMLEARRRLSDTFVAGDGIEIGALHQPLALGPRARVRYVDRLPVEQLRRHYPELADYGLVDVDIIDDGEVLSTLPPASLDFIIANHMLEHCENPVGTLRNHLAKVVPGGILYYAVPDKDQCFDRPRMLTTFEHLLADDRDGPAASREAHFREWVTLVNRELDPAQAAEQMRQLMQMNYSIHFHTWDAASFQDFLARVGEFVADRFSVEHYAQNNAEIIAILRKAAT